jgi:hypothetical protein
VQQIKQVIATPLAAGPWTATAMRQGHSFLFANANALRLPADLPALLIALRLSTQPAIQITHDSGQRLLLLDAGLPADPPVFGRIEVVLLPEAPFIEIINHTRLAILTDALPDPIISGVIEFVTSEARLAEKKRGVSATASDSDPSHRRGDAEFG